MKFRASQWAAGYRVEAMEMIGRCFTLLLTYLQASINIPSSGGNEASRERRETQ
jgi:hypothetical protein